MKSLLGLLSVIAALATTLAAQSIPFTWSGELRLRSEFDARDMRNNTPPNLSTLSRARIGLLAQPSADLSVFLQIQDARSFGEEPTPTSSLNAAEVHQAWLEVRDLLPGLSVKAGKMELHIGNGRLISNNLWLNVPRTLTGMTMAVVTGPLAVTGMLFNTRETPPPPSASSKFAWVRDNGDLLAGAAARTTALAGHSLELIALHHRIGKADALGRDSLGVTSLGGFVKGAAGPWSYEADASYQTGSMFGADVSAFNAGAILSYATGHRTFTFVTAALDVYSGQTISATSAGVFDPRFGAGHKNLGFMDYFTSIPAHTAGRGIIDGYGRLELAWSDRVGTQVTVHHFQLHRSLSVAVPSTQLGQEVDVITRWKHSPALSVEFGAGVFIPGRAMKTIIGGSDPGVWMYLSPQVSF
ncbi:MAG: alginate export family protein [Bacteroidetes bacterium]|jgi:hypothetical protein|nr:alginate export family protein [Bacteroidota bacterium]